MWWDRSRRVEVYLGQTLIGCKGLDLDLDRPRWNAVDSAEDGVALLERWLSESDGRRHVRVWLGSTLARPLVLSADCGARSTAEAAALAQSVANERTGRVDVLKVWTARWRADRSTLAVAMPHGLWDRLCTRVAPARDRRARIDSVRPWWSPAVAGLLARSRDAHGTAACTIAEPDGIVLGEMHRGQVVDASFESRKHQDPDGVLLRRRLAVSWQGFDAIEHRVFSRDKSAGAVEAIGSAPMRALDEALP